MTGLLLFSLWRGWCQLPRYPRLVKKSFQFVHRCVEHLKTQNLIAQFSVTAFQQGGHRIATPTFFAFLDCPLDERLVRAVVRVRQQSTPE